MNEVNKFYKKIFGNLKKSNTFIKEKNKDYKYQDVRIFYSNFFNKINFVKKKEIKIATLCKKSFKLYSSIISILLTKNVWVPLDEDLPKNILEYIIRLSKTDLVLIDNSNETKFKKIFEKLKVKYLNIDDISLNKSAVAPFEKLNYKEHDLAMIFFTSGSTGKPKGVKITNKNFISSLNGQLNHIYKFLNKQKLVFGDYHNTSFVISLNILLPCFYLCSQIAPAIKEEDKLFVLNHAKKNKVNCIVTLPSTINRIKFLFRNSFNVNLAALLMCGEPFYYDNLKFITNKLKPKHLFNCYGSTELSPWVFSYKHEKKNLSEIKNIGLVPIGKKFYNVKTLVKKDELLINGPMVNRYLLDKQNYKNHKTISKKIWYITNDRIKIKKNLFYVLGRSDSVIKLRGYRIELRGIEAKIREYEDVKNCFVFLSPEKNKKIIAAIETDKRDATKSIENFLSKNLQNYMIPKKFIFYKNFPKNKNGKIDRKLIKGNYNE
tara:strand:+ start:16910 stop:18379 length:1470 start_codon:yes stop_codon:yes gene_type:complete